MSIRKLAGQTAVYGISSIVARLLNYLLTPYLTRIMTTGEYGVVTDMYALIPLALVVLTLGMETGFFRFAGNAATEREKADVFSSAWGATSLAAYIFFAITLIFTASIAAATGYPDHPSYIRIVGLIIAVDVIAAMPFALLRQQGRPGRYVVIRITGIAVNVLLCLFFYSALPRLAEAGIATWLWRPAFGPGYVFVANLIGSLVALGMLVPSVWSKDIRIKKSVIRPLLIYSMPLLLSGIAGTANEFIDRQMIKYLMPEDISLEALGIYGAVVKLGVILILFTQMYRLGAEPYFLGNLPKDDFVKTNAEAMKWFIAASIFIFLGIVLYSDLFAVLIGRDFREGMYILPVVLLSNILIGVVFNLSFWYKQAGKTKFALLVTGTGLVLSVSYLWLVPRLGIYGAAIAHFICEAGMVVVSFVLNRRYCRTPYDIKRIAFYVLCGAAIYFTGLLTARLPVIPEYLCNFVLLTGFVLIVARTENINLKSILRR